jgi:hypothetical protein
MISLFPAFDSMVGVPWGGCVRARVDGHDLLDTPPNLAVPETLFTPYFAPDEVVGIVANGNNSGVMAFGLLLLRYSDRTRMLMPTAAPFGRIRSFAERGVCPYGLAMGAAALVSLQPMFASAV